VNPRAPPGGLPSLVIAFAGSGKTRTNAHLSRGPTCWLIVLPQYILLLNLHEHRPRAKLLDRVANLPCPTNITGLWGGTFHSVVKTALMPSILRKSRFLARFSIMYRAVPADISIR